MTWYDNLTYASKEGLNHQPLPLTCCNGPSCKNIEPDYMQKEPFISTTPTKLTESDREWIACQTAALKKWRSQTSTHQWLELGVNAKEENMPDSAIMSKTCLVALAKQGELLQDRTSLVDFLKPWYGIEKYTDEIFKCIQENSSYSTDALSKSERKATLKAARTSKKLKYMDDPVIKEEASITALRDQWLIERGKAGPATKAQVKKAATAEKKLIEKQEKLRQKKRAKSKDQDLQIKKLALGNRQAAIDSFKAMLSDLIVPLDKEPPSAGPSIED